MTTIDTSQEVWRRCQWPAVRYEVSNLGRIRHARHKQPVKTRLTNTGYLHFKFSYKGKQFWLGVHQQVAFAFCEGYDWSKEVDHVNGCKTDNRAENLEWVTHSENVRRWWRKRKAAGKEARP